MGKKIDFSKPKRDGRIPVAAIIVLCVVGVLILIGMGLLFRSGLPGV